MQWAKENASLADYLLNNKMCSLIWRWNLNKDHSYIMVKRGKGFWSEVFKAWCADCFSVPENKSEILEQTLWFNSNILTDNLPVVNYDATHIGFMKIRDIVNEDGIFYCFEEIVERSEGTAGYLQNYGILSAILRNWKEIIRSDCDNFDSDCNKDVILDLLEIGNITNHAYVRDLDTDGMLYSISQEWSKLLNTNVSPADMVQHLNGIHVVTNISNYCSFQYRLLMHAIVLNDYLYKCKIKLDNRRSFCKNVKDEICYISWLCPKVQNFWDCICLIMNEMMSSIKVDMNLNNIIFNIIHENRKHVCNFIILIAKQYLYRMRCFGEVPSLTTFKAMLYKIRKIEKYNVMKNDNVGKFNIKWNCISIQDNNDTEEYIDRYVAGMS